MAAFAELGAASVVNHGVGDTTEVLEAVRSAFADPSEAEKSDAASPAEASVARGYIAQGGESGSAEFREAKEGFSYGHPSTSDNRWPPGLAARPRLEQAYLDLCRTSRAIVSALATRLERLDDCCDLDADRISLARLFHYFPSTDPRVLGSSPHTDWGMLTLVLSDDADDPALQIWHRGVWRPVRSAAGALLLNAGDYLALVSRGASLSPRHRVVSPTPPRDRVSLVFFYYPDYNATIPAFDHASSLSLLECQVASDRAEASCANARLPDRLTFGDYIARKWREVSRPSPDADS